MDIIEIFILIIIIEIDSNERSPIEKHVAF